MTMVQVKPLCETLTRTCKDAQTPNYGILPNGLEAEREKGNHG